MKIKETTEFGLDMIRGLPKAYYCAQHNIPHKCIVKKGLGDMYKLVTHEQVEEITNFCPDNPNSIYRYKGPEWIKKEWSPPPLKQWYKDTLKFDKPVVVINNKCTAEWELKKAIAAVEKFPDIKVDMDQIYRLENTESGPNVSVNHYSLPMLAKLIELLSDKFKILYVSPLLKHETYFEDSNPSILFNDFDFIEKNYPQVYTIRQFLSETDLTNNFNIAQFMFEASSEKHLTVIGGNSKVSSYFEGDVIIYRWEGWRKCHPKGNRDIFKTGSWLKHLSGANIIGLDTYDDILTYIKNNWL